MEIVSTTPYVFLPFDCSPAPSIPALSFIVKGTFSLRHGMPAIAAAQGAQQPMAGDDMHMDDLGRSLRYASDLVPVKVSGEVTVHALCHAPDGRPRASCDVSIAVGPIQKTLRVSGDRVWMRDAEGLPVIGRAQPFEAMPVRWERAFGGLNVAENPLGRGAEPAPDDSGRMVRMLPNVEYVDRRVASLDDQPPPAGFGPISPMWEPRRRRQGTRDQRWAMFRAPLPPKDMDPRCYSAAPDDQQLPEGFFRGDEAVVITGLHRDVPVYRSALPGKRLRLFALLRQPEGAPSRFVEVEMKLDTAHIDMEKEELVLLWRRPVKTKSRAHAEIEAVYITEEDLADEPLAPSAHEARFRELRRPKDPPLAAAAKAEIEEQRAQATKILRDANADPELISQVEGTSDPQEVFKILIKAAEDQIKKIDQMAGALRRPPV